MKKFLTYSACVLLTALTAFCFTACDFLGGSNKEYIIQYTYDGETVRLNVKNGEPYVFDEVPEKEGYAFLGLFDSESGGTQYVNSSGASVNVFSGKSGLVLYPQFKANEYTVILDYQGAQVTGERQLSATYDLPLPALPEARLEHYVFTGWFTEEHCGGVKVADGYGLLPQVSVVNSANFDLSSGRINLYAGFELQTYTVNLNFKTGVKSESIVVAYNTPVSELNYFTRVNGEGVLSWSKTQGGQAFTGNITEDIDLYALEYAPVIELDCSGGEVLAPVVARAGAEITLPVPQNAVADFMYWQDEQGNRYTETAMPSESIKLKAVWQSKIVFDSNGGTEVDDILISVGGPLTLPVPEKAGYIFAGWYDSDKTVFDSTSMPAEGIALKAGWYKENSVTKVQIASGSEYTWDNKWNLRNQLTLDFSDVLPESFNGTVRVEGFVKIKHSYGSLSDPMSAGLRFYSDTTVSASNLLHSVTYSVTSASYSQFKYSFTAKVKTNKIYCAAASDGRGGNLLLGTSSKFAYYSDCYYNLYYPDITKLYL